MRVFWALLSTEATKLKHTAALWLSICVPLGVAVLLALEELNVNTSHQAHRLPRPPSEEWTVFLPLPWNLWGLAGPILIAVVAACLIDQEHRGRHWKQLFAMPIPRWSIFATKILVCGLLTAMSSLLFCFGVVGVGLLGSALHDLHMASQIPWGDLFQIAGMVYLASWSLVAIQMWLSMRFTGMTIPVAAGLGGVVLGTTVAHRLGVDGMWPWTMPRAGLPWATWPPTPAPLILSPILCMAVTFLACRYVSRRDIL